MLYDPLIDPETLEKLESQWKKSVLAKQKSLPPQQKFEKESALITTLFQLIALTFIIGLCLKITGMGLSSEAHFSGIVILFSILGVFSVSWINLILSAHIPEPHFASPISNELLLLCRQRELLKFTFLSCFISLLLPLFLYLDSSVSLPYQQLTLHLLSGVLLLLTATASAMLISRFVNPFKFPALAAPLLIGLFFLSFHKDLTTSIYTSLYPALQYTPVGLCVNSLNEAAIQTPFIALAAIAISSIIIIERHLKALFKGLAIDRAKQEVVEQNIYEAELLEATEAYSSSALHDPEGLSVRAHLTAKPHGKYDILNRAFDRWLTSREKKILNLSSPPTFTSALVYAILALIAIFTFPTLLPLLQIEDPFFSKVVPSIALIAICLFNSQTCTSLLKDEIRLSKTPQISYLPIGYKELITLHSKIIAFSALWNIPLCIAALSILRQNNGEAVSLPISHILFTVCFYFCSHYLTIYTYHQVPNIISKVIGRRLYKIISLLFCSIGIITLTLSASTLTSGLHTTPVYYASLIVVTLTVLLGFTHYKSYRSMRLDI